VKKLALSDILPPRLYEPVRDDMRRRIMEIKRPRRISLGPIVTLVFENRATLIFQIQEMLRAEHIETQDKIQAEIDIYNDLIPEPAQLSATLFVEITEQADIRPLLERMVGIDEHITLCIGEHAVAAEFEPGRSEADRISSVQYIRFTLPPAAMTALRTPGTPLVLVSDHPRYDHRIELGEETRQSLAGDLD
jgi:hypothetical protein